MTADNINHPAEVDPVTSFQRLIAHQLTIGAGSLLRPGADVLRRDASALREGIEKRAAIGHYGKIWFDIAADSLRV